MEKKRKKKTISGNEKPVRREGLGEKTEDNGNNTCRCKEISRKTFPELLKVIISDLSPWKKAK